MTLSLVLVLAAGAAGAQASPASRPVATDLRAVLRAAIDSPDGTARAVLRSPETDAIGRHFKATSPMQVDVRTVTVYKQKGCRRLHLRTHYDNVVLPGSSGPKPHTVEAELNFCHDGRPRDRLEPQEKS